MGEQSPPLTPEILVPRIGEYLVEKGLIGTEDLHIALDYQQTTKKTSAQPSLLGQILVQFGKITRSELDQAITELILQLRQALQNANQALEQRVKDRTAQLEEALYRLSEANQVKANIIANVSHEFRTPLTHIRGYVDLLYEKELGPISAEQREALQVMQRSTSRLEELIGDLILFSDSQKDGFLLNNTDFSILNLANHLVDRFSRKATEKAIELVLVCNPEIPKVLGDEEKIGWVMAHLLDNALKFTASGGSISLTIEPVQEMILVSVKDTGIGIAEDRIDEIFEPFHQLDGSSTRKYGGTGLGLSLAKRIVEAHGSNLKVSSQVGKGSQFEFLLNAR